MISNFSKRLLYWLRHQKPSERKALFDSIRKCTKYSNKYVENIVAYGREFEVSEEDEKQFNNYKRSFNRSFFIMLRSCKLNNKDWSFTKTPYDCVNEQILHCEYDIYGILFEKLLKIIQCKEEEERKLIIDTYYQWINDRKIKDEEHAALREFRHQIADYKNYSEFKKDFEEINTTIGDTITSLHVAKPLIDLSKYPKNVPNITIYYSDGTLIGTIVHKYQFDWFRLQAITLGIDLLYTVPCLSADEIPINVPGKILANGQVEIKYIDAYPFYESDAVNYALKSYLDMPVVPDLAKI